MDKKLLYGSIAQTYQRAKAEGIGVSRYFIRNAVLSGSLPSVKSGNKYIISWQRFIELINTPQPIISKDECPDKIRHLQGQTLQQSGSKEGGFCIESKFIS